MDYDDRVQIAIKREYKVVKANEIIQRARYELSLVELKTLAYILSLIKPNDTIDQIYTFTVADYCQVCGIDYDNGKNYLTVKQGLKALRDKSFFLIKEDGTETTVGWLDKVWINKGSGKIRVRLDEDMEQYVKGLISNFTQYELLSTLPMRSRYSFRLYELLKSYAYQKRHTFDIVELKKLLAAETYVNFKDFRKKVLEIGIREINLYTDIEVVYQSITKGRKVIEVAFEIRTRDAWGVAMNYRRASNTLNGQMDIYDFLGADED